MRVEVNYHLRKSRGNSQMKSVYCHISVNGKRTKSPFSTGVSLMPNDWDSDKQLPINAACEDYTKLYNLKEDVKTLAKVYDRKEKVYSAETLKSEIWQGSEKFISFLDCMDKLLQYKISQPKKFKAVTIKTNRSRMENIRKFLEIKKLEYLPCEEFKPKIVDMLRIWLYDNLKSCSIAHYRKHVNTVKETINYACLYELAEKNPLQYLQHSEKIVQKKPIYLTHQELEKIEKYIFLDEKTEKVMDCFMFCCYTGLAFVDMRSFDLRTDTVLNNGRRFLKKDRQKTEIETILELPEKAILILNKYNSFQLPQLSKNGNSDNKVMNDILKIVFPMLGITKQVTTHTARKTACRRWLRAGVSELFLMKMMGWTSIRQLRRYAEVDEDMMAERERID